MLQFLLDFVVLWQYRIGVMKRVLEDHKQHLESIFHSLSQSDELLGVLTLHLKT